MFIAQISEGRTTREVKTKKKENIQFFVVCRWLVYPGKHGGTNNNDVLLVVHVIGFCSF